VAGETETETGGGGSFTLSPQLESQAAEISPKTIKVVRIDRIINVLHGETL
jgi:hypothetical protein